MTSAQSSNQTLSRCSAPLLDQSLFWHSGGHVAGRYCGLDSVEAGTTCCFYYPIQDWLYHPGWQKQFRVPNYLSVLSVALCTCLLISFAALPPEITHRHYLSIGLLFSGLSISLSFAIPLSTNPSTCYDAITPHDMSSSASCAWTGSLITVGGIGSVVWVFLRSLWLHVRIVWDFEPGKIFVWTSIVTGTAVHLVFLGVLLSLTGFSYRMGQTCLPDHKHAIVTFWAWLLLFAVLAILLQSVTTGYCFFVYLRTLRREKRASVIVSYQRGDTKRKLGTWRSINQLFILQWRNIFLSIFVIAGSVAFFVTFWTQDGKLERVLNDPVIIIPVKTSIVCLTLSMGNRDMCRRYVADFTVDEALVPVSLIMASLAGLSIFVLHFRLSFIPAWITLSKHLFCQFRSSSTPLSPQLTSLDVPEKYQQTPVRRSSRKIGQPSMFFQSYQTTAKSPQQFQLTDLMTR